jgi:signal transduction histidine kinase
MPKGGTVELKAANTVLTEDLIGSNLEARLGEYVWLRIRDTGHGMPPAVCARVFEPFFTTKPVGQGFGLGLAMAYGIVQEHQGWISCQSEVGKGAQFDIYLPRYWPGQVSSPKESAPAAPADVETGPGPVLR